jgi:phosphoglycolate phosphatase-like HAD superfamily hydrolase
MVLHYKNLLWDFDGCLFDTYPSMNQTFTQVLQDEFDINESLDQIYEWTHISITYCAKEIAKKYNIDEEKVHKAYSNRYYHTKIDIPMPPMSDAEEICELVVKEGGRNFIFTHRKSESTYKLLEKYKMEHLITEIVAPNLGFYHKPSPAMLYYLIDKYEIGESDALVIGDRPLDVETGLNAGISGCFYSPNSTEVCEKAKFHIAKLIELREIILEDRSKL